MKIYNENKTSEEVIEFVSGYYNNLLINKRQRIHTILSFVPQNVKILDYGCGWGVNAIEMAKKGCEVVAIDISENEIEICKTVWGDRPNLKFTRANISEMQDDSFDAVLSTQVVEHVHNVGHYLSEINRVLKQNGKLIISLPNVMTPRFLYRLILPKRQKNLKLLSINILNNYDKTHHHINAWDPTHFVTLCASIGFELEEYSPAEGVPMPFKLPCRTHNYWYTRIPGLRNLSYTMVFRFRKAKNVSIEGDM